MPTIVFLCVANSARSQLAEAINTHLAPTGWETYSAGSRPGTLNPLVPEVLRESGIDAAGLHSKGLDDVPLATADLVITLCAEEECPVSYTRGERLHWPLPDPGAVTPENALDAFRAARDELRRRLTAFWREREP